MSIEHEASSRRTNVTTATLTTRPQVRRMEEAWKKLHFFYTWHAEGSVKVKVGDKLVWLLNYIESLGTR